MENKEKEPTLKEVIKDRCSGVDVKLNNMAIIKRKTTVMIIFIVGILVLIINTLIASYINKPKDENIEKEKIAKDSLEIVSNEIDVLFQSIYSDSTAFYFTIEEDK